MWIIKLYNDHRNERGLLQLVEDFIKTCQDAKAKEVLNFVSPGILSPNKTIEEGWTPLCFAARRGLVSVVDALVAIPDVDVNATDQVVLPLF